MRKNYFLLLPLFGASTPAFATDLEPKNEIPSKPLNIVYIMTDDHSYQTMSCYDGRYNSTPGFDRIASEGMLFERGFVTNSISGPSRAVLMTGKHSHLNGFINNSSEFDGTQQTFPKLLQQAGYQTAIIGKWHLVTTPTGFDHWEIVPGQGSYYNPDFITADGKHREQGYITNIITDKSIEWLENRDKNKPFCLLVNHKAIHRIWMSDTTHLNDYEDVTFDIPETFWDNYEGRVAAEHQKQSIAKDMDLVYDLKMLHDSIDSPLKSGYGEIKRMNPQQLKAWDAVYQPLTEKFIEAKLSGDSLTMWKYQRYMRDYLKCVKSVDENVAKLYNYLETNDLLDNTVIIYTSDQGFYMGEHGWFDKRFIYEESLRTPLLIRLPNSIDAPRGVSSFELVQNLDYAPTILSLCNVEVPKDMQGLSMVNILKGKKYKWRDAVYYHYYEYPDEHRVHKHYGIRGERYKLANFYEIGDGVWELFDLQKDPSELKNVYNDPEYKKVRQEMHRKLNKLQKQYNDNTK